jgi:hypothetical protein
VCGVRAPGGAFLKPFKTLSFQGFLFFGKNRNYSDEDIKTVNGMEKKSPGKKTTPKRASET